MIGDRHHDMLGARNNAMQATGVLYGYGTREELSDAGASRLAHEPRDLVSLHL
jgi:phosphoglycolate phosphatase